MFCHADIQVEQKLELRAISLKKYMKKMTYAI